MNYAVPSAALPWTDAKEEALLLRRITFVVFFLFVLLAAFATLHHVPAPEREELEALPPQLARFVKQKAQEPKPVQKPKVEKAKSVEKPKDKPEVKEKPKPIPTVKKKVERVETKKATAEQVKKAREVASQSGILALQSEMSALSQSVSASAFSSKAGSSAKAGNEKASVATVSNQALNTTSTNIASESFEQSSNQLELADSQKSTLSETKEEAALAQAELDGNLVRKEEDIQLVVEGLRSTFNLLYNRALRSDPFLEGKLVLSITIESSGVVSNVVVLEDSLGDKSLVSKLIARMKLTNFGPTNAPVMVRTLPFEFQPS